MYLLAEMRLHAKETERPALLLVTVILGAQDLEPIVLVAYRLDESCELQNYPNVGFGLRVIH